MAPTTAPLKRIQELSAVWDEPPPAFLVKDKVLAGSLDSVPSIEIPIIDLSLLLDENVDEINKLSSVLNTWGVFQLKGHGMSSSYLEELRNLSKDFFSLPMEEKQKCSRASDGIEGYGPDPILAEGQVLDWCDRIFLTVYPEQYRNLQHWPQNPPHFREKLGEYGMKVKALTETLLKITAKSQNMEEDSLVEEMGENTLIHARFNYYPKCPKPNQILGLKAHADASAITYILQDKQVEGYQVFQDGQWYGVPTSADALLVNIGEQFTIISNGVFKSPLHRVGANSERERRTIAVSYSPNYEKEIEPLQGFIDSQRPRIFRRVKNYYNINVDSYFAGKIAIDTVKISYDNTS